MTLLSLVNYRLYRYQIRIAARCLEDGSEGRSWNQCERKRTSCKFCFYNHVNPTTNLSSGRKNPLVSLPPSTRVVPKHPLLIQHVQSTSNCLSSISRQYTRISQLVCCRFSKVVKSHYSLWALFKPSTFAYTTCPGTKKPRCIKYDFGEEKTMPNGMEYFHIGGRYVDFSGKVFGEVSAETGILRYRGSVPINSLDVFLL